MGVSLSFLMVAMFSSVTISNVARAAEPAKPDAAAENRTQALIPDIEAYIANGMSAFDVPGLAIGIVAGDKLVYAKGIYWPVALWPKPRGLRIGTQFSARNCSIP